MTSLLLLALLSQQVRDPAGDRTPTPTASTTTPGPSGPFTVTADTLALWHFDESGVNPINVCEGAFDTAVSGSCDLWPGNVPTVDNGIWGNARTYAGLVGGVGQWSAQVAPVPVAELAALLGEWTVSGWVRVNGSPSGYLFSFLAKHDTTSATNHLFWTDIEPCGGGAKIEAGWDYGNNQSVATALSACVLTTGSWGHVAVRKKLNGSNYDVDVFVDGVVVTSSLNQPNATGGEDGYFFAAGYPANLPNGSFFTPVTLDDWRVLGRAQTDAEILQDAQRRAPVSVVSVGRSAVSPARATVASNPNTDLGTRCTVASGCP